MMRLGESLESSPSGDGVSCEPCKHWALACFGSCCSFRSGTCCGGGNGCAGWPRSAGFSSGEAIKQRLQFARLSRAVGWSVTWSTSYLWAFPHHLRTTGACHIRCWRRE
eukprot:g2595.t1